MDEGYTSCNFLLPTVIGTSNPVESPPVGITERVRRQAVPIYKQVRDMIFPRVPADATDARPVPEIDPLNVEPGEWVEVRPLEEISETLDGARKYKGLHFIPEMETYCGQKFRVFKKVATIKLESTGEVRRLKSPTGLPRGGLLQRRAARGVRPCLLPLLEGGVAQTNPWSEGPAGAFRLSRRHVTGHWQAVRIHPPDGRARFHAEMLGGAGPPR